jgi:glucosylceramidase
MKPTCLLAVLMLLGSLVLSAQQVKSYRTTADLSSALRPMPVLNFSAASPEPSVQVIAVDAEHRYQTIDGFGASLTDSSAWLLHDQLSESQRREVMKKLFDPSIGIGVSFLRQPVGASDLARNHYSYDEMPTGQKDPELRRFSLRHDNAYLFPVLREALKINPSISVMATPWSPPSWMKTSDSMIGGSLRDDALQAYADYLVKTMRGYRDAGVPVRYLSVQNEPQYEPKDYPGALMPAAQQKQFIGQYLGPALERAGLKVKLLAFDHNWDHPEYPIEVVSDPQAGKYLAGSALHCYEGDVSGQLKIHDSLPEKGIWLTECSGGTWQTGNILAVTARLIIESTRNWAKSVVLWGMVLDERHGPNAGGCDTCRGLITVDRSKSPADVEYTVDYYAMGSASKFVRPGAVRIDSTTFSRDDLESVAFQNTDRSIVVLVLNNKDSAAPFALRWQDRSISDSLPPGSFTTYIWRP